MTTIMKVVGFANFAPCSITGQYLESFDHEADGGRGYGTFTFDRDRAMKFDNFAHAIEFWRKVPRCMPLRPDGEPNRPLTCTTWDFEPFDVAELGGNND